MKTPCFQEQKTRVEAMEASWILAQCELNFIHPKGRGTVTNTHTHIYIQYASTANSLLIDTQCGIPVSLQLYFTEIFLFFLKPGIFSLLYP